MEILFFAVLSESQKNAGPLEVVREMIPVHPKHTNQIQPYDTNDFKMKVFNPPSEKKYVTGAHRVASKTGPLIGPVSLSCTPFGELQGGSDSGYDSDDENGDADLPDMLLDFSNLYHPLGECESKMSAAWLPDELEGYCSSEGDSEDTTPPNVDVSLLESLVLCIRQLLRARDSEDFGIAVVQFLKAYTGKSMCALFGEVAQRALAIFRTGAGTLQSGGDENIFTTLRKLIANSAAVVEHPLLQKFKKVLMYTISFATLTKMGVKFDEYFYSAAEKEAMSKQYSSKTGFLVALFDGLTSLLERLIDCYHTGTWSPLLASSSTYAAWTDTYYDLKMKSQMLHNPDACGFSYFEFLGILSDTLEKGRAIAKYESNKNVAAGVKRMVAELELIQAHECTKKAARASRDAPYSILYYGGSSLAKTTLQDLTHTHFAKTHGLPDGDEYKYPRISADQFYSGFMSQMWSIVIDDIANLNPNLGLDPSMGEVQQLDNNAPYCPPQADLSDKGKTPVLCQLLQGSTNTKHLNAHAYYNNTLAIMRRWNLVVTVTLKAEYCMLVDGVPPEPHARMLDGTRTTTTPEGEYPDMWEFKVEKVVNSQRSTLTHQVADFKTVLLTDSIYDYLAFVSKDSRAYREQQLRIRQSTKVYKDVSVCGDCFRPVSQCKCDQGEMQSKELATVAGIATATLMAAFAPRLGRVVRNYALSSVKSAANEVARDVIANTVSDAKGKIIPYVVDFLRNEGIEVEGVSHYQPTDQEIMLQDRLNNLATPALLQECWYDAVQRHLSTLPGAQRLETERRWIVEMMSRFGKQARRVRRRIWASQEFGIVYTQVIGAVASMMTIVAVSKVVTYFAGKRKKRDAVRGKPQGGETRAGFEVDEKPNPWYNDIFKPSKGDFSPLTTSWKALTQEQLVERVSRNVNYVESEYVNSEGLNATRTFRMLCLGAQLYVTNAHSIPVETVIFRVTQDERKNGITENYRVKLHPGDFYRDPEHDLIFFRIRCVPPKADLRRLLVSRRFETMCNGLMITRTQEGVCDVVPLRAVTNSIEKTSDMEGIVSYRAEADRVTVAGECGSPYIGIPPMGPVLLGLHMVGGWTNHVSCVVLTQESVAEAIANLNSECVQPCALRIPSVQSEEKRILDLHPKSTFRYIEAGVATVYGSISTHRSGGKSKVRKTLIHDSMLELGYEPKMGGPVLNHWKPWRSAAVDISQQDHMINCPLLDRCSDAYLCDVMANLPVEHMREIRVLTIDEAVNGIPGVKYIDRLNLNSSMGFPWNSSKRNFVTDLGVVEDWQHFVALDEDILLSVEEMRVSYSQGVRCMAIFRAHQKDEVVSLTKIAEMKTRLFSGGNGPLAILMRQYFLPVVRLIQRNKFSFEAAPGTNAMSLEWCDIYHWLTPWGTDRMMAGDYSKFDKRMSPAVMLASFSVLERILEQAGLEDRDMTIVRTMKWDIVFAITEFNGDIVQWWGSNPSGHILTVIINCIANSLYMRYAWSTSGHELSDFRTHVRLITYGDDNVLSVSPKCGDFNHRIVQHELSLIGVVYTMADKETESIPFIPMHAVSFLKRKWVYSSDVGSYIAQLEHDSIEKSLLYHIPSEVVCVEKLATDAMNGALREYFAYGREIFDDRRESFLGVVEYHRLQPYFSGFVTYDQLVTEYLENGMERSPDGRCVKCAM